MSLLQSALQPFTAPTALVHRARQLHRNLGCVQRDACLQTARHSEPPSIRITSVHSLDCFSENWYAERSSFAGTLGVSSTTRASRLHGTAHSEPPSIRITAVHSLDCFSQSWYAECGSFAETLGASGTTRASRLRSPAHSEHTNMCATAFRSPGEHHAYDGAPVWVVILHMAAAHAKACACLGTASYASSLAGIQHIMRFRIFHTSMHHSNFCVLLCVSFSQLHGDYAFQQSKLLLLMF